MQGKSPETHSLALSRWRLILNFSEEGRQLGPGSEGLFAQDVVYISKRIPTAAISHFSVTMNVIRGADSSFLGFRHSLLAALSAGPHTAFPPLTAESLRSAPRVINISKASSVGVIPYLKPSSRLSFHFGRKSKLFTMLYTVLHK